MVKQADLTCATCTCQDNSNPGYSWDANPNILSFGIWGGFTDQSYATVRYPFCLQFTENTSPPFSQHATLHCTSDYCVVFFRFLLSDPLFHYPWLRLMSGRNRATNCSGCNGHCWGIADRIQLLYTSRPAPQIFLVQRTMACLVV